MSTVIPEKFVDLLARKKTAFAYLATVKKDNSPQLTVVWFDWDGQYIVINTARGRVKDKVMHRNPQVAGLISDPANPYRCLRIQGHVAVETEEGARAQIDDLAEKYTGERRYASYKGETRVTYKILPQRVQAYG